MSLLGKAALAMWWHMAPTARSDFEDWHAHEHFPERLSIPGFRRGTRWMDARGGEPVFVMYELEDYDVIASAPYLARLNAPTPWSTRLMPHHRNMVRSQCRVLESVGGVVAAHALTVRLSPAAGEAGRLRAAMKALTGTLPTRRGLVGVHLLQHEAPPIATTTEQKIRGNSDQVADWVVVACGYDREAIEALAAHELSPGLLAAAGAQAGAIIGLYALAYSATAAEISDSLGQGSA
ncbi:hypothetical protein [Ramlibacter sp.]|uniref:hypothetical protein n=1 Tax=Ramlibacter sp. TaxID=1917967 RepID=UPI002FCA7A26